MTTLVTNNLNPHKDKEVNMTHKAVAVENYLVLLYMTIHS